jgi:hypothetical protein
MRKTRLGCVLGLILFPVFNVLDRFVYKDQADDFLILRFAVSAAMALLYPMFSTRLGQKYYRLHGLILLTLPSMGIAWMIHATEGAFSPYYAGLTFVLMFLAVVLDWTFVRGHRARPVFGCRLVRAHPFRQGAGFPGGVW